MGCIYLFIEDKRIDPAIKERFILDVFKYSIIHEELALAVRLLEAYTDVLVRNSAAVNEYLYTCFAKSPFFMEIKLYILDKFFDGINYL